MSWKSMSKASEPQLVHFRWGERQPTANGACHVIVARNATFAENDTLGLRNACSFWQKTQLDVTKLSKIIPMGGTC